MKARDGHVQELFAQVEKKDFLIASTNRDKDGQVQELRRETEAKDRLLQRD